MGGTISSNLSLQPYPQIADETSTALQNKSTTQVVGAQQGSPNAGIQSGRDTNIQSGGTTNSGSGTTNGNASTSVNGVLVQGTRNDPTINLTVNNAAGPSLTATTEGYFLANGLSTHNQRATEAARSDLRDYLKAYPDAGAGITAGVQQWLAESPGQQDVANLALQLLSENSPKSPA